MNYYYIVFSQQDILKNIVIEELLRERTNYYINKKNQLDFWIVMNPSFLFSDNILKKIKKSNFYTQQKKNIEYNNSQYFATIITTNIEYLRWIKLRIGYFENIEEINETLNYKSDGIFGIFNPLESNVKSPFLKFKNTIHPDILVEKYKKSLEV
uniref:Ycf54 n=1 Tax=Synura uvella TaxID=52557 RepID=A0A3G2QZB6_9STRA|nr:ycf54 [Synura uvella]AYO28457.1 ycf54 [Synura uvella]